MVWPHLQFRERCHQNDPQTQNGEVSQNKRLGVTEGGGLGEQGCGDVLDLGSHTGQLHLVRTAGVSPGGGGPGVPGVRGLGLPGSEPSKPCKKEKKEHAYFQQNPQGDFLRDKSGDPKWTRCWSDKFSLVLVQGRLWRRWTIWGRSNTALQNESLVSQLNQDGQAYGQTKKPWQN